VPYSYLTTSPSLPGVSPAKIYYRDEGDGIPLVFLHGGWGYGIYPFNRQIDVLQKDWRIIIPDRSGYGRSTRIREDLPTDFHRRAATETLSFMDALDIERAFLWGHSDGAVIAAMIGLTAPDRIIGLILKAFHYRRVKSHSREFYETQAYDTELLGPKLCQKFESEHGQDYWKTIISTGGKAWLRIADESNSPEDDLYGGKLRDLRVPTTLIHGKLDPRTEPAELDAVRQNIQSCDIHLLETAHHSPHSENATADMTTRIASDFLKNASTEPA
jgi:pimeloyl-ACP methyl ester carboxylesterase